MDTLIKFPVTVTENKIQFPIKDFDKFYAFYLTEHRDMTCRRLHVLGSSLGILAILTSLKTGKKRYLAYGLAAGYACAWVGHFKFEHNKPASFKQPLYSFISDWRMFSDIATGRLSLIDRRLDQIPS